MQSYAQLKDVLQGEELQQHHLIPKSLFMHGPRETRDLIDYIPSVPLSGAEHLKTLHSVLNDYLKGHGLWQRDLSATELSHAVHLCARFYAERGLNHFAQAIREFAEKVIEKIR